MLDGLAAGLRFDGAAGDRRALQRREDRPQAEADDEHADDREGGGGKLLQAGERRPGGLRQDGGELVGKRTGMASHDNTLGMDFSTVRLRTVASVGRLAMIGSAGAVSPSPHSAAMICWLRAGRLVRPV